MEGPAQLTMSVLGDEVETVYLGCANKYWQQFFLHDREVLQTTEVSVRIGGLVASMPLPLFLHILRYASLFGKSSSQKYQRGEGHTSGAKRMEGSAQLTMSAFGEEVETAYLGCTNKYGSSSSSLDMEVLQTTEVSMRVQSC